MNVWSAVLSGYLVGAIPFAWLAGRIWTRIDLREVGSGNVGAANVARISGPLAALAVAVLDATKGAAAVALAGWISSSGHAAPLAGVAAVVGHVYPVWLRFRGGKGVATTAGAFALLAPAALLLAAAAFIVTVGVTRYVSLGSMVGAVLLPACAWWSGAAWSTVAAAVAVCALVIHHHRSNLARLVAGTERRLGQRTSLPN